jgi:hypothetical protein
VKIKYQNTKFKIIYEMCYLERSHLIPPALCEKLGFDRFAPDVIYCVADRSCGLKLRAGRSAGPKRNEGPRTLMQSSTVITSDVLSLIKLYSSNHSAGCGFLAGTVAWVFERCRSRPAQGDCL